MLELDLTVSGVSEENKLFCESSEERFANCEIICPAVRKVTAFVAAQPVAGVSHFIIIRVIKARAVILRSQLLFFGSVKEIIEGTDRRK